MASSSATARAALPPSGASESAAPAIDFVVNARMPTEKAHGLQVARQCEALADAGARVRLFHALRFQSREMAHAGDLFAYYQVRRAFAARALPSLDLQLPLDPYVAPRVRRGLFLLQSLSFAAWALLHACASPARWIYTRDPFYAAVLVACGRGARTVFEEHRLPERGLAIYAAVLRRLGGVVTITRALADRIGAMGVDPVRIHVAPDGVRVEDYANLADVRTARVEFGLEPDRDVVVYTGHLFEWKGVDTLMAAAARLPQLTFLLAGGLASDLEALRRRCQPTANVIFLGHRPPGQIPRILAAASVLVLPNSGGAAISRHYTSPLKLFEYMATGRPIIASNLESLREILSHEQNALLFGADDAAALAAGIESLLADPARARRLAAAARNDVEDYTWKIRAHGILRFLESQSESTRVGDRTRIKSNGKR